MPANRFMMLMTLLSWVAAQQTLPCVRFQLSQKNEHAYHELNEKLDGLQADLLSYEMNGTMDREIREIILTHCPGIYSQLRADVSISSELQFETCDSTIVTEIQQQKFMNQLEKTLKVFDNSYVQVKGTTHGVNFYGGTPIDVIVALNISELILNDQKYSILGYKFFSVAIPPARNFQGNETIFFNTMSHMWGRSIATSTPAPTYPDSASVKQGTAALILSLLLPVIFRLF